MSDKVSSKDALFMLDTDIEADMESYADEATALAIKYINKTPELYKLIKAEGVVSANVAYVARKWAQDHGNEFGELFETELDVVKWNEVARKV